MKRSVALALTIAILAAIAVCFLRPATSAETADRYFGLTDEVFVINKVPLNLIEGGDLFQVAYLGATPHLTPFAIQHSRFEIIPREKDKLYTRGAVVWERSKYVECDLPQGELRRKEKGEWISAYRDDYGLFEGWDMKPSVIGEGRETLYGTTIELPISDVPGELRVTIYVRECVVAGSEDGEELYSSVGEAIPITFEAKNPLASGKDFDIIGFDCAGEKLYDGRTIPQYSLLRVRKNNSSAEFPYIDTKSVRIEGEQGVIPPESYFFRQNVERYNMTPADLSPYEDQVAPYAICRIPMPEIGTLESGDYRLTATFCENPDGSGERYTLTLRLRFEE